MSRKEALALLGFKETDNPSFAQVSAAASAKISALKKEQNIVRKTDEIIAIASAEQELKKNLPKDTTLFLSFKPKKRKVSWLLWAGIPFTLATAISTFCSIYFFAPALFSLPKVASALLIAGIATGGVAFVFCAIGATAALLNFIATRKYDEILNEGGISEKMLTALNLGLKSKAWGPYFECFTQGVTYQFPLAYRAGMTYATNYNQEKIKEIVSHPHIRLSNLSIV